MPGFTGFVAILFSFNCQRQDYKGEGLGKSTDGFLKREKSYGIMNVIKIVCCWAMKNLNFISNKEFKPWL